MLSLEFHLPLYLLLLYFFCVVVLFLYCLSRACCFLLHYYVINFLYPLITNFIFIFLSFLFSAYPHCRSEFTVPFHLLPNHLNTADYLSVHSVCSITIQSIQNFRFLSTLCWPTTAFETNYQTVSIHCYVLLLQPSTQLEQPPIKIATSFSV